MNTADGNANLIFCSKILELDSFFDTLLCCGRYIAKSNYLKTLSDYKDVYDYFSVLKRSGMLELFCRENGLDCESALKTLDIYENIDSVADTHNEKYISDQLAENKEYFDEILKESDPNIVLDENQRRVILTDEDYCLVIAGAGAGKTTTVAAKVKYLVEKQKTDPKKILVVSFTNYAVNELKKIIIGDLHIECPIATFHSTGNAVIRKDNPEKLNIVQDTTLYFVVQKYLKDYVLKNESLAKKLILFFASYFDVPYEGADLEKFFNDIAKSNFTTIKSETNQYEKTIIDKNTRKTITIQNEKLRSKQEVEIANFLYLNNISYEYEPLYPYTLSGSRKPYTPDFIIRQGGRIAYIEHFGITEKGCNDRYSADELASYKKSIADKISLHKAHNSTLITTYSVYNDKKSLTEHLEKELAAKGFVMKSRPHEEVISKLVSNEENRYIKKLVMLITRFISNFKVNGFSHNDFAVLGNKTKNVRTRLFLDVCEDCYLVYQRYLKEHDAVDFQDMINESARILREKKEMNEKIDFDYIIVDEYQDISRQRFDLVAALHSVTNAKIIAVGDDWQSIYAFSGSDITLFTKFEKIMGYAKLLKIVRTYRNSQEVIDIAGNFIKKNRQQIQKDLISPKHLKYPVVINTYDVSAKEKNPGAKNSPNYMLARAVEDSLGYIDLFNRKENKTGNQSVLLIGRFGFDGHNLEQSGLFRYINRGQKIRSEKYPYMNITFLTAHASKGLGYDNVIIVNGRNEIFGFPCKIEDDPVLKLVLRDDRSIEYAEERRLFYVAMTRTKNRVFFVAPRQNPSEFLLEIKRDYPDVTLIGDWDENYIDSKKYKTCPVCGYPLQYRYKPSLGLRLYICTNEPEICGFMTNNISAGKLGIIKCDSCKDGYLIPKRSPGRDFFLGCTGYTADRKGCNRTMSRQEYYVSENLNDDPVKPVVPDSDITETNPGNAGTFCNGSDFMRQLDSAAYETKATDFSADTDTDNHAGTSVLQPVQNDFDSVVRTILGCLEHISEKRFFGVRVLIDVLRGSESKKILQNHLDAVCEYASLKSLGREDIRLITQWLVSHNYILQTKGLYPVLHPTYEGRNFKGLTKKQQEFFNSKIIFTAKEETPGKAELPYPENLLKEIFAGNYSEEDGFDISFPEDIGCRLENVVSKWTPRKKDMFLLRYREKKTLQQIGEKYSISRERVRQIIGRQLRLISGKSIKEKLLDETRR